MCVHVYIKGTCRKGNLTGTRKCNFQSESYRRNHHEGHVSCGVLCIGACQQALQDFMRSAIPAYGHRHVTRGGEVPRRSDQFGMARVLRVLHIEGESGGLKGWGDLFVPQTAGVAFTGRGVDDDM